MARNLARLSLFILPPALTLTCALSETPETGSRAVPARKAAVSSLEPSDAETPWRWIGLKSDLESHDCPDAPGWTAGPLFAQEDESPIPLGLRGFCLYEGTDADASPLKGLVGRGDLAAVAPDHMAVGTSANELKAAMWQELRDHFLARAGDVDLPVGPGPPPRLAFADTGPTNAVDPENGWTDSSPHGYTLANLAKELLCDSAGACLAEVTSRLALPHTDLSPDRHPLLGGYIGTLGEAAVAIRGEVHAWETAAGGGPLIVNLSLGWDGVLFGGVQAKVEDMPLGVRAVYRAIEDAVCRGALVVAAAGNVGGGPDPESGPLHPAAWEQRPAPSYPSCVRALRGTGKPDPSLWPAAYWPLVWAAGGVGAGGGALANARPGGEPGLAAFADHAVAADSRGAPTATLTGSSVAAAVVSAAAAAVWHYRPGLKPHEVMALVYDGGDDLSRDAEYCLGGTAGLPCPLAGHAVRRVSLCAAVDQACASGGGACPASLPSCPAVADLDLSSVDLGAFLDPPPTAVDLDDKTFSSAVTGCGGETLHYSVRPPDPCPHHQYYGLTVELWIGPQPGSNPCSACWMDSNVNANLAGGGTATLRLEIDPDFDGTLTSPTLILGVETYDLDPASTLFAGDQAVIENVPVPLDAETPILLSFTLNGTRSVVSPVLVTE